MQNGEENKYLGKEKISKLLLKFSIPCILALLITSLYNIVDQIFIGHGTAEGLGAVGNAATSIVFPLTLVAVAFAGMLRDGTAAFMSICQERKDTKNMHYAVGNSMLVTLMISAVLVLLGFVFCDAILGLFGASADNIVYARQYFYIILTFFPVYMLGYMLNSAIRADGAPAFAMVATVAGAITNIILDPIFIFVLGWGIQGAAWATITGQILTLIISLVYLTKTKTFRLKLESFKPSKEVLNNVTKLGISTFITQLSIVIISMICNKMLAIFGADSAYVISIFGSNSENPELYMQFATLTFRIFLMLITFTCIIKVISIFFQAVGEPLKAAVVSLSRDIVLFVPLVLILPNLMHNINGILWAAPVADVMGFIISVSLVAIYFRRLERTHPNATKTHTVLQKSHPGIIITIARQHGSQGKKIGEMVAKQLNIPYYYKELTALAAQESGLDRKYIKKINSNDGREISEELYLTTSPAKYAIEAQDVILKDIAKQGSCVIVGRAADYVLRNHQPILRVFIYADEGLCTRNVMQMYGDDEKTARKNIARADKNRSNYYEMISGQKWGDPQDYDLCIDAGLGKETVANLIVMAAKDR